VGLLSLVTSELADVLKYDIELVEAMIHKLSLNVTVASPPKVTFS
jgi:hypothetical protein